MAFPRPRDTRDRRGGSARVCDVFGANGEVLAQGVIGPSSLPSTINLDQLSGRGALLGYYFARGQREVIVCIGDFQLRGRLRTTWTENHREWQIDLEPTRAEHGAA